MLLPLDKVFECRFTVPRAVKDCGGEVEFDGVIGTERPVDEVVREEGSKGG